MADTFLLYEGISVEAALLQQGGIRNLENSDRVSQKVSLVLVKFLSLFFLVSFTFCSILLFCQFLLVVDFVLIRL